MDIKVSLLSALWLTKNNSPNYRKEYGERKVVFYELELILDGTGKIICNGNSIKTLPGRLFLRTPGMIVNGFAPYHSIFIVFELNTGDLESFNFPYYMDNMMHLKQLFEMVYLDNLNPDFLSAIKTKSVLLELIYQVLLSISGNTTDEILKSIKFIDNNFCENIEINSLAKASGYSSNHFIKLFKQAKGITPIKYINYLRIAKACTILSQSNNTIESVATDCGFESASYFYRIFKKVKGVTPAEFRNNSRRYYVF